MIDFVKFLMNLGKLLIRLLFELLNFFMNLKDFLRESLVYWINFFHTSLLNNINLSFQIFQILIHVGDSLIKLF